MNASVKDKLFQALDIYISAYLKSPESLYIKLLQLSEPDFEII